VSERKIFVGRKAELKQFRKVLENPRGQAVLVVGQAGMGKTWLINKMAELAENHPNFKCGYVRYEVTPTDSVDSTMALMMDNAFDAAQIEDGSFSGTAHRLEQWRSILNVINLGDLVMSLRRDPTKNTRDQFLERLQLISKRMPENGRAIFIIDPEKYMQKYSDQSWAIVVKGLPDKIKIVFAQRTEDVLVESATFKALDNISRIPEKRLDVLEKQAVDELLDKRITEMDYSMTEVRKILSKYKGHPYALQGALDLLKAGTKLEELPNDPTGIAIAQWKELCKRGKDAIRLFKAYAILEVGVPDEVVTDVSELDTDTLQSVLADNFIGGLLREEGYGKRIYHAILADHIVEQIGGVELKQYHNRAADLYRQKLAEAKRFQTMPDVLSATRLPEHVLVSEGKEAFVSVFVNECFSALRQQGFLDAAISMSERALDYVKRGSKWEAAVMGNLGGIYERRGELDKAETIQKKALRIDEEHESPEGMALRMGSLGQIYRMKGHLHKAEQIHKRSLEIAEDLGAQELIAHNYIDLSIIYMLLGELDRAQDMSHRALEITESIKLKEIVESVQVQEIIATAYGNMAAIHIKKGQVDKAEQMIRKSLQIAEVLGMREVIANQYSNLGQVYKKRGNLKTAQEYWYKSLKLFDKIGMPHMVDKVQGWIDELEGK